VLLASPGVGSKVVDEIEDWLAGHGKRFQLDPFPVDQALAQALDHLEAVLERGDDAEFLAAFVALPQLRRSLRTAMPERCACRCP